MMTTNPAPTPDTPLASLLEGRVHAPGVVFGMPSDDYHADCSLGSSDVKRLTRSAADYWHASPLNAAREPDGDSPARRMGRAEHKLVLEGEIAFSEQFAVKPEPSQFPGCLVGAADLKTYCKNNGLKTSGTKAQLSEAVRTHQPDIAIWDDIIAAFERRVRESGCVTITRTELDQVRRTAATVAANPHLARAFSGGASEVSVFWRDTATGAPCKARYDYMKPSAIIDLKRIANERGRPFEDACTREIGDRRYDIQAVHYLDGWAAMWTAAMEGRVSGHCALPEGWERFLAEPDDARFVWVFHQATGAPVARAFEIGVTSAVLTRARREVAAAKRLYADNLRQHGAAPWVTADPIMPLRDADLPPWMRGDGGQRARPTIALDYDDQSEYYSQ